MNKVVKTIWEIAESFLEDDSLFIVDINVSQGRSPKVTILVDGDNGVTIETCSKLSRAVGNKIEEDDVIKSSYTLDVGSPGLETPLKSERQFRKNIGRALKVRLLDGSTVKAKLIEVDDQGILLISTKKKEEEEFDLKYNEIDWAKVQVSFNNI